MITLLTDFGTTDYFVGAVKGVILSVNPDVNIVDITHEIPPFDIEAAAFNLLAAYSTFEHKTIHVAIVDPGVGSERRPILVASDNYFFVGPDNGLFSYVYEREPTCTVYHLTNEKYFRHPVSSTFHGRDIFAPVAGALSNGVEPTLFGDEIEDFVKLPSLASQISSDGVIEARIIHIDHFGNCITNLTRDVLTEQMIVDGCTMKVGGREITSFLQYFAESKSDSTEIFSYWGSADFLEIAAFRDSAARVLAVQRGERVIVAGSK